VPHPSRSKPTMVDDSNTTQVSTAYNNKDSLLDIGAYSLTRRTFIRAQEMSLSAWVVVRTGGRTSFVWVRLCHRSHTFG
jgi:hypothetical protein